MRETAVAVSRIVVELIRKDNSRDDWAEIHGLEEHGSIHRGDTAKAIFIHEVRLLFLEHVAETSLLGCLACNTVSVCSWLIGRESKFGEVHGVSG